MLRALLIIILFLFSLGELHADEPKCVNKIELVGNTQITNETIESYLDFDMNQRRCLDKKEINNILKKLYATGQFENLSFRIKGNKIIIKIKENPAVSKIIINGNDAINKDSIKEAISLKERFIFTNSKLQESINQIKKLYKKHDLFFTDVTYSTEIRRGTIIVKFNVNEHNKIKIRRIKFFGNESFTDKELAENLYTQPYKLTRIFGKRYIYNSDKILIDKELLRQFYISKGFAISSWTP